jgi:hypothetical protein
MVKVENFRLLSDLKDISIIAKAISYEEESNSIIYELNYLGNEYRLKRAVNFFIVFTDDNSCSEECLHCQLLKDFTGTVTKNNWEKVTGYPLYELFTENNLIYV